MLESEYSVLSFFLVYGQGAIFVFSCILHLGYVYSCIALFLQLLCLPLVLWISSFFEFRHLFSFPTFSLFMLPGPIERVNE